MFLSGWSWDDPGFVPGTNPVKTWGKPGFSPYFTQWKPDFTGLVPGTNLVVPGTIPGTKGGTESLCEKSLCAFFARYFKISLLLFSFCDVPCFLGRFPFQGS